MKKIVGFISAAIMGIGLLAFSPTFVSTTAEAGSKNHHHHYHGNKYRGGNYGYRPYYNPRAYYRPYDAPRPHYNYPYPYRGGYGFYYGPGIRLQFDF